MEIIVAIIASITLLITIIISIIVVKRNNAEKTNVYNAAENIIREDLLNYSIQNTYMKKVNKPSGIRVLVYIKSIGTDSKNTYVFDPVKVIRIGRKNNNDKNSICLNDIFLSHEHCAIYSDGERVFIKDMNSKNGTIVKHKRKRYYLNNNNTMELFNKDKLYLGSVVLKVTIFTYYSSMI